MEITKNKMINAQPIAMIFCRLLVRPAACPEARERLLRRSAHPNSATHTQMRLSASSMVKSYGMHSTMRLQQAIHCSCVIWRWPAKNQGRGGLGGGGTAGAVAVGGAGAAGALKATGLAKRESSICGSISIFSAVRVCLISVPGLRWSIRNGNLSA